MFTLLSNSLNYKKGQPTEDLILFAFVETFCNDLAIELGLSWDVSIGGGGGAYQFNCVKFNAFAHQQSRYCNMAKYSESTTCCRVYMDILHISKNIKSCQSEV